MLVSMIFWRAINSFPFVATNWIQNKMVVQIETSTLELNEEEVTALARHRPQACA